MGSLETQLREAEDARRIALDRQLIELTGSAGQAEGMDGQGLARARGSPGVGVGVGVG